MTEADANWSNTDNADWRTVLQVTRGCAMAWEPEVRLLGNVKTKDIVRAIDEALNEVRELTDEVEQLRLLIPDE